MLASIILLVCVLTPAHTSALGEVGHRLTTKSGGAQQARQDIRALETGKPVERQLAGDGSHIYELALVPVVFARCCRPERRGRVVTVLTPKGKQILEVDSPTGTRAEEAFLVSEERGSTESK
jgi:hypothetical protein